MSRTREQVRGQKAFEHAEALKGSADKDDYGRYAHKLPILIRTAGLAQAIAFTEAKAKGGALKLLDHLAEQAHASGLLEGGKSANRSVLSAASKSANLAAYRMLTHEIQACLVWYKRFAVSVLDVAAGDDGGK
jgi:CRISPR-associated protein Cmr5